MLTHAPSETLILRPDPARSGRQRHRGGRRLALVTRAALASYLFGDGRDRPGKFIPLQRIRWSCVVRSGRAREAHNG